MTDSFKPPAVNFSKLKRGDRVTFIVLGPNDDKTHKVATIYPADMMVIAFDPAPPVLEPRCEVEFDHPDGVNGRMVGEVIALHDDLAWVQHRLTGHGLYPQAMLTVIREAKK